MPESNPLHFSVINSIKDISREEWDGLFGNNLPEDYGYHKTLEESGLREFSFGYLIGKRRDKLTLIIPFFIMDFSFTDLIPEPFRKLSILLKNFLTMRLIFLGSPTTEEFYLGADTSENLDLLLGGALKKLYAFSKEKKAGGILFYNLSAKNKLLAEKLRMRKFIVMESLPTTLIEINAGSAQEYINGLGKNSRKNVRKKLEESAGIANLRTEIRENIGDIAETIYKLYLNNFDDSSVHFEILTPDFFKNISQNMPGAAKFFITYDKDKVVAFNLCLIKDGFFIDKFIGFDSLVSHKYHLYFTTFCHNIGWCIKNGIHFYQPGTTDYYPKMRLGAKLIPLYIYAKAFNPLLNLVIKLSAPIIAPKNLDSDLKSLKE